MVRASWTMAAFVVVVGQIWRWVTAQAEGKDDESESVLTTSRQTRGNQASDVKLWTGSSVSSHSLLPHFECLTKSMSHWMFLFEPLHIVTLNVAKRYALQTSRYFLLGQDLCIWAPLVWQIFENVWTAFVLTVSNPSGHFSCQQQVRECGEVP